MIDVLPVNRGRVVPKVATLLNIDLDNDDWVYELPVEDKTDTFFGGFLAYLQNHEWKVWTFIIITLIFI